MLCRVGLHIVISAPDTSYCVEDAFTEHILLTLAQSSNGSTWLTNTAFRATSALIRLFGG